MTPPRTRPHLWAGQQVPEVALLPGDGVEHGGHHEQPAEPKAVDPGGDGLPVIVRQEVEVGTAEDAGDDPELEAGRGRSCEVRQVLSPGRPPRVFSRPTCPTELPVMEGRF